MSSEVKEIVEDGKDDKRVKRYPVPFSYRTRQILVDLQGRYLSKHKKKITLADLAGKIIEKSIKNASI